MGLRKNQPKLTTPRASQPQSPGPQVLPNQPMPTEQPWHASLIGTNFFSPTGADWVITEFDDDSQRFLCTGENGEEFDLGLEAIKSSHRQGVTAQMALAQMSVAEVPANSPPVADPTYIAGKLEELMKGFDPRKFDSVG